MGRPQAHDTEQDEDGRRPERYRLQKAEKEFTESHYGIMGGEGGGVDVTLELSLVRDSGLLGVSHLAENERHRVLGT
jgi:hypothetical protein